MSKFLNFLGLGKSSTKDLKSQSMESDIFPEYDYKLEFLKALKNTPVEKLFGLNTYWEGRYTELLGKLEPILRFFLSNGFLEKSLKEESLTIKELKVILKSNSLPISGKKHELAQRVFYQVKNKDYQKGLKCHYKISETGTAKIKEYEKRFEEKLGSFLIYQSEIFLKGNLKEYESNYLKLKSLNPDQRSLGGTFTPFHKRTNSIIKHLSKKKETREEWNFSKGIQEKFRAVLAIKAVDFWNNSLFLRMYFNDLEIKEIKESLGITEQNALKALEIAIEFEYKYLYNKYTLEDLLQIPKRQSKTSKIRGVQILNDGCICQQRFGTEKFEWKDLSKLPKLPRALFCQCIYNGYSE